jgi:GTP-binding protein
MGSELHDHRYRRSRRGRPGKPAGPHAAQTEAAIDEADLTLFVVDAKYGLTPRRQGSGEMLRRRGKPVVLVANKSEAKGSDGGFYDAYTLGLGEPTPISAEHGQGMLDLRDAIVAAIGEDRAYPKEKEDVAVTNVDLPQDWKTTSTRITSRNMTTPSRCAWRSSAARMPASRR